MSLLSRLRLGRVGPQRLSTQGVDIAGIKPLYDSGKLAWWARWTYALVVADLVVTASACDLVWNYWTMWEALPAPDLPAPTTQLPEAPSSPEAQGHYVPRPLWQRLLFTTANMVGGVGLAAVLLGGRSRIVRRLYVVPAKPAPLVVIQSPLHTRAQGVVHPLRRLRLAQGPDPAEMMVGLKDGRGHYSLSLKSAEVGGRRLPLWDARREMFTAWYGEKKGTQMYLNSSKMKEGAK